MQTGKDRHLKANAAWVFTNPSDHIVLGLDKWGLEEAAAKVGGRTLMGDGTEWITNFQKTLANPSSRITVSLDGVSGTSTYSKVMSAAQSGASKGLQGGPFNWEMSQIVAAGRQATVTFVQGGQEVANPFK